MKIIPFIYNDIDDLYANTYLLVDNNNDAVVIDPSQNNNHLADYIIRNSLNLKAVLLTHGHFDHLRGLDILVNIFNVPFYMSYLETDLLTDPFKNCSLYLSNKGIVVKSNPQTLCGSETLNILDEPIVVVSTPYHTEGSISFYLKESKALFTGDALFEGSIGRDDLPTSVPKERKATLERLMSFPSETKVYPGHGRFTSIQKEKVRNAFINR